nr:toprim domain-containing protein [uncultured Porphyromonas sp.]
MTIQQAKQLSIIDYLAQAGYKPTQVKGNAYWYRSPLREERTASFKVNADRNQWYDFATGQHGDLIDLVSALHHCSTAEALTLLSQGTELAPRNAFSFGGKTLEEQPRLITERTVPLSHPFLLGYLAERGIDLSIAKEYCKEVYYSNAGRSFFSIGFPNASGGWELRSRHFKGCASPKDISLIEGGSLSSIYLFEGFMDFLSWRTLRPEDEGDCLVLNSLALLPRALPQLHTYSSVRAFLDNDDAGLQTLHALQSAGIEVEDMSQLYAPHKDLNEHLINRNRQQDRITPSKHKLRR